MLLALTRAEGADAVELKVEAVEEQRSNRAEILGAYCNHAEETSNLIKLLERARQFNRSPVQTHTPEPRPERIAPAIAAEIVARYEAGERVADISRGLGIHRYTVSRHLDQAGIARWPRSMTQEQIAQAASLYAGGKSLAAVGTRLGSDSTTIYKELLARGVEMRPRRAAERRISRPVCERPTPQRKLTPASAR